MSATIKVVSLPKRSSGDASDVTVEAPDSGSGWVAKAAIPFSDSQGAALAVVFDNTTPANAVQVINEDLAPIADDTVLKRVFFPRAGVLSELAYYVNAKPASTGGTVLFTALKNGSTTVLSAANVNAEGLTDDTYTKFTLSGTPANLAFAAGEFLELKIVSDNADMTAGTELRIAGVFTLD